MDALWKITREALPTNECFPCSITPSPRWASSASNSQRASTVEYLRHRGRALLRACHGRMEDFRSNECLENHLNEMLAIADEEEFALRADRLAGTITFRFAAMDLATRILCDDMHDYFRSYDYELELPGGSRCASWDEAAWEVQMKTQMGVAAFAERMQLVQQLMDDAGLTTMTPPFRPGLNQGWSFMWPIRYMAAALVGSGIPDAMLHVAVRNLAKACRARAMGVKISDDEDEDTESHANVGEDNNRSRLQGLSTAWNKTMGFFR